ncbi:serine O-acetyltransferase EpsC [Williamwhitmania taraxaci]|uniref:Serine O-acetyltransferase n=1 Tax=Williamwhitmania taraxaci TaxID=1640674 RepID=A0A1G6N120_9BACT|nr:serine O-acetyltransferase EpsC [Williamwhitmania taraxaci]SDC60805.1 serine O-acetyltransferase [Williamwhitmania taraxaci]
MTMFFNADNKSGRIAKEDVRDFLEQATNSLYPSRCGRVYRIYSQATLRRKLIKLLEPLASRMDNSIDVVSRAFFMRVPFLKVDMDDDAKSIAENDPAASGIAEVILAYPGFYAIMVYRLAHELFKLGVPMLPRMITEQAHSATGIDIHPGAIIGKSFFIDHGTGIVIGETAIIGNRVKLYQGVTIGALNVSKAMAAVKRHPTIEDDVVIYAGATILGGSTKIGHDSIIGGNVWLTESIPPSSLVYHKSEVRIRQRAVSPEQQFVLDYSI